MCLITVIQLHEGHDFSCSFRAHDLQISFRHISFVNRTSAKSFSTQFAGNPYLDALCLQGGAGDDDIIRMPEAFS